MAVRTFTAVIHKEEDLYVAECPKWVRLVRDAQLKKLSRI
ncbi:MAG: hypothetical protein XU11_C0026G0042 [Candidatus Dadabacteria bacterium CSP1-2]|nr:MAG: hypothetical protein XU11_C0026G0042 [Candidatus Dadabacteria bacterium CSP1-2]